MKYFTKVLIMAMAVILFLGCQTNEEETQIDNYLEFNGETHEIKTAVVTVIHETSPNTNWMENPYGLNVLFLTKEIAFDTSNSIMDVKNVESLNDLTVISFSDKAFMGTRKELESTVYNLGYDSNNEYTFRDCELLAHYSVINEEYSQDYTIDSGILSVNKKGNEYEFSFQCETESGISISGQYKGAVDEFEVHVIDSDE
jgi:uncharacterized lipoprotein YajG